MSENEALLAEAGAGLVAVAQALGGLGLTPLQEAFVRRLIEYEQMRIDEGWVDDFVADLAAQLAGSP